MFVVGVDPVRADLRPLWAMGGVAVTPTDSTKWAVRIVPDGASGFVAAWEDNRGRRVCCRDTRDLYAQRVGPGGAEAWSAADVQVAADGAGEELLGIAPGAGGGALLLWRRGGGTLYAQQLDAGGKPRDGLDGRTIFTTVDACEWVPATGCAIDPGGAGGLVAWAHPALGGGAAAVLTSVLTRSADGWLTGDPVEVLSGPGLHPAAVAACGGGLRLVVGWTVRGRDLQLEGRWVDVRGRPDGPRFLAGPAEPGARWVHAEAAGDGHGGAWVLWAAVNPEAMGKAHRLRVAWIGRSAGGATTVVHAAAGEARTLAMFIPPTMVGTAGGPEQAATNELVAWRPTSVIASAGSESALIARFAGDRLEALVARRTGGRIALSAARDIAAKAYTGFGPKLVPAARGSGCALLWAEEPGTGSWAIRAAVLRAAGRGLAADGTVTLAGPLDEAPRLYDAVTEPDGTLALVWTAMQPREFGRVRAQRVGWSEPAAK